MANDKLASQAGNAVFWKGLQLISRRGFSIIRLLVLARLLLPEDFGLFSIALLVVETVMSLTDVGMIPALVQQKEVDEDKYHNAWTVNLVRGIIISILTVLFAPLIAQLFAEPAATDVIRLLALRPLIDSLASIKLAELTRNLDFKKLTLIHVPAIALETIFAILLAPSLGVWALVVSILIGALICLIFSYIFAPYRPKFSFSLDVLRPLIQFGRWIFLTKFIAILGASLLQIVISRQLGTESLGLYYLAMKLAFLPNDVAGEVVGAIAFPMYARIQNDPERIKRAFQSVFIGMAALLYPVYGLLIVLAPDLVLYVLGDKWLGTAPVIQVLSIVGIVGLFGDTIVPIVQGTGRPYITAIFEFIQSGSIILFIWFLASQYGLVGAASAWLPAIALSQIAGLIVLLRIMPNAFKKLAPKYLSLVTATLLGVGIAIFLNMIFDSFLGVIITTVISAMVVGLALIAFDTIFPLNFLYDLQRTFPPISPILERIPIIPSRTLSKRPNIPS